MSPTLYTLPYDTLKDDATVSPQKLNVETLLEAQPPPHLKCDPNCLSKFRIWKVSIQNASLAHHDSQSPETMGKTVFRSYFTPFITGSWAHLVEDEHFATCILYTDHFGGRHFWHHETAPLNAESEYSSCDIKIPRF